MRSRQALWMFLCFVAGIACTLVIPRLADIVLGRLGFQDHYREVGRVTSPDGAVDAVMEEADCGAPCSAGFFVSIVPRNAPALRNPDKQQLVFAGDDLSNARVRWSEPHLVEIGYDKGLINSFHNVVYPFGRQGNIESWRYAVEIRLAPSSSGFSYLKVRQ